MLRIYLNIAYIDEKLLYEAGYKFILDITILWYTYYLKVITIKYKYK